MLEQNLLGKMAAWIRETARGGVTRYITEIMGGRKLTHMGWMKLLEGEFNKCISTGADSKV